MAVVLEPLVRQPLHVYENLPDLEDSEDPSESKTSTVTKHTNKEDCAVCAQSNPRTRVVVPESRGSKPTIHRYLHYLFDADNRSHKVISISSGSVARLLPNPFSNKVHCAVEDPTLRVEYMKQLCMRLPPELSEMVIAYSWTFLSVGNSDQWLSYSPVSTLFFQLLNGHNVERAIELLPEMLCGFSRDELSCGLRAHPLAELAPFDDMPDLLEVEPP